MQAHSFGEKNVVGLGSNSLSQKQARLILQLNPQKVIFALDEGLDLEQTERNIKMLRSCMGMNEIEIYYWNYTKDPSLKGTKNSPTDMGRDKYLEIMNNPDVIPSTITTIVRRGCVATTDIGNRMKAINVANK